MGLSALAQTDICVRFHPKRCLALALSRRSHKCGSQCSPSTVRSQIHEFIINICGMGTLARGQRVAAREVPDQALPLGPRI